MLQLPLFVCNSHSCTHQLTSFQRLIKFEVYCECITMRPKKQFTCTPKRLPVENVQILNNKLNKSHCNSLRISKFCSLHCQLKSHLSGLSIFQLQCSYYSCSNNPNANNILKLSTINSKISVCGKAFSHFCTS